MEACSQRVAARSDLKILRSELGERAWGDLARLLDSGCTRAEWILLSFEAGALADVLALTAPSEFNRPLEIIRLLGGLNPKNDFSLLLQQGIETAKSLGVTELYCTVAEDSPDVSSLVQAGFCRWRKVVRFESAGPVDLDLPGYRSIEAGNFTRAEIIALMEKTSERCCDSQIELYRQRLGGKADAEMTLQMMESITYDPRWWRVALSGERETVGIIFPVVAFGEPTIGYIGVIPEHRGRNIASFLLSEAWSLMERQGHSTLSAEADERNIAMHRVLTKSQFNRQPQKQEWRLESGVTERRSQGEFGMLPRSRRG
jgi:GNAT superfamily N-acetyltransferase